jgi:endonuclease YncB( thermonuclease family)
MPVQLRHVWQDLERRVGLAVADGRGEHERSRLPHEWQLADADLVGVASVIDGDTIEIHGQRIRLHGIDAPESSQTCLDADGQKWRCGQRAALALQDLIGRRTVTCDERDVDRYGRVVGRCLVDEIDINEWLVAEGLALAYRHYSMDYVAAEATARAARRGMWAGTFEPPWDWRHRH